MSEERRRTQIGVRLSEEELARIDLGIQRRDLQDDAAGLRADYLREAGLLAAGVDRHGRELAYVVASHAEVMRRSRPRLAPEEWRLVCDALNGTWLGEGEVGVRGIPLEIADACDPGIGDLSRKWLLAPEADEGEAAAASLTRRAYPPLTAAYERGRDLVQRLAALSYAELASIADTVRWWWAQEPREVGGPVPGEPGWVEPPTGR